YRRRYDAAQRQRVKWFMVITGILVLTKVAFNIRYDLASAFVSFLSPEVAKAPWPGVYLTSSQVSSSLSQARSYLFVYYGLVPLLMVVPQLLAVIAFLTLIRRYRLWQVDLMINRGLVIGGVTLILGAIFFATIFVLQAIFVSLLGG